MAIGRDEILIEEIEEDELARLRMSANMETPSKGTKSWKKKMLQPQGEPMKALTGILKPGATALPARGGEWIIDSGSSFHIIAPADMTTAEQKRIYPLTHPVPLNTAQGEATVKEAVHLVPFV